MSRDLKESWGWACGYLGKEHSRQRKQQVQRAWGGMCLEYVWTSKEARVAGTEWARKAWEEMRSDKKQTGPFYLGSWGPIQDFDFYS